MASPAADFQLRPARQSDQGTIKRMVRRARLNPMGINWQRFTLAESEAGDIIGCVQLKPHGDGSSELASLIVARPWRGKGLGGRLINVIKAKSEGVLWLMCRRNLVRYYRQFGFEEVQEASRMSPYFRRIWRLARIFLVFSRDEDGLAIMRWQA